MFWDNTAHSGLIGLVVLGLPRDCTAIGGFTATLQWNYGVFSSTASSLVATHLKIGVGKVGVNLNVFGPNPVAHLRGNKFISISGELQCMCIIHQKLMYVVQYYMKCCT